jgi:hypothetical protein
MIRTTRSLKMFLGTLFVASASFTQQAVATPAPVSTTVAPKQGDAIPVGELNPSSFGISPSTITVTSAARNGTFANDITIFNSSNESQVFQVSSIGPVATWTRFGPKESPVSQFDLSVGPGRTAVRVEIAVPSDAANGTYDGAVLLSASPATGSSNGVSVTFEVGISVVVDGEQIVKATYSNLAVATSEVGVPSEIRATVANTGNVALPVNATAEIKRGGVLVETLSTPSSQTVLPGSSGDIVFNWDTKDALPGDYSVAVDITAGELKLGSKQQTFRLEAPGKLTRSLKVEGLSVAQEADARPLLSGTVRNDGQIAGRSTVSARIVRDGKTVSVVQGDSFYVSPGQNVPFALNLPLLSGGKYSAEVTAELDDYRSPVTNTTFTVAADSTTPPIVPIAAGIGVVGLLAIAASRRRSRRTRHAHQQRPVEPKTSSVMDVIDDAELRQYETL